MAAWSDHEWEEAWGEIRPKMLPEILDEVVDSAPHTEPFPEDVWVFFSDADLDQLVVDVCKEMGRRELVRRGVEDA